MKLFGPGFWDDFFSITDLIFQSTFRLTAKLKRKCREFPLSSAPPSPRTSLLLNPLTKWYVLESVSLHWRYPVCMAYIRIHSWYWEAFDYWWISLLVTGLFSLLLLEAAFMICVSKNLSIPSSLLSLLVYSCSLFICMRLVIMSPPFFLSYLHLFFWASLATGLSIMWISWKNQLLVSLILYCFYIPYFISALSFLPSAGFGLFALPFLAP